MRPNRNNKFLGMLWVLTLVISFIIVLAFCACFLSMACYSDSPETVFAGVDLSSPETTLAGYIESLRKGDSAGVRARYFPSDIDFFLAYPIAIERYEIVKRIVFGKKEVERWNSLGIMPQAKLGDVELQVKEWIGGTERMFSYYLRNIHGKWKIFSHSAWGVD
jgi:hypothetical protein